MTTISHNRKRRTSPLLLVLLVVLGGSFVVSVMVFRVSVANILWHVGEPILTTGSVAQGFVGSIATQFFSKASLIEENNRLREALASSSVLALDRATLYEETLALKARLERVPSDEQRILAGVLLHPPGTPYDTLIIDIGRNEGVQVGNVVSPGGTLLIGTIDAVYDSSARVKLFSAPGESHEGYIGSLPVVLQGQGGGSFRADIPAGEIVTIGSKAVFPGIDSRLIADVVSVDIQDGASFTTVHLSLPVNIFSIQFVEVLPTKTLYEQE